MINDRTNVEQRTMNERSTNNEVEGIQGAGPQILFGGAGSPKSPDHGDNPPLLAVSPPPPFK